MPRFGRECASKNLTVEASAPPFSNFAFVEKHFGGLRTLRRILSQARSHLAKTMVIEDIDPDDAVDLREENEDLRKRYGCLTGSRVCRLSFFTKPFLTEAGLKSATDAEFIGYAILKTDEVPGGTPRTRVFESVLRASRHDNNFVRGASKWKCQIGTSCHHVSGYIYAQQNGMTNSCAHVACRTAAARYHPDGDMTYRQMNDLPGIGINHTTKTSDGGLTSAQIVEVLEAAGARCIVGDYTTLKPGITAPPFHKYIYGSIESGSPAIICFATTKGGYHAVPVFGHTFNEDTWVPCAERSYFRVGAGTAYTPSDSWLSAYVAHDDNWGSNFCIPRHFLYTSRVCRKWPAGAKLCEEETERVAYVIATFPKVVQVSSIEAEVIGADFFFSMLPQLASLSEPWEQRLRLCAKQKTLILRPVLISASQYASHLSEVRDWNGKPIRGLLLAALKSVKEGKVWMVELSVPELFQANRRKVGEVLIRAEISPGTKRDFKSFFLARLPSHFALYKKGGPASPEYSFIPSGIDGHVQLWGCEDS